MGKVKSPGYKFHKDRASRGRDVYLPQSLLVSTTLGTKYVLNELVVSQR